MRNCPKCQKGSSSRTITTITSNQRHSVYKRTRCKPFSCMEGLHANCEPQCNKMTCPNCSTVSCYICRKVINGYEHFDNVSHDTAATSSSMGLNDLQFISQILQVDELTRANVCYGIR